MISEITAKFHGNKIKKNAFFAMFVQEKKKWSRSFKLPFFNTKHIMDYNPRARTWNVRTC